LQTLAITFTGSPIPFARTGSFPPEAIKDIIKSVKDAIKAGKEALNVIKEEFRNTVNDVTSGITRGLEKAEMKLNDLTKDNFANLQKALPDLFSRTGSVATARQKLLDRLGSVTAYANDPQNSILGMTVSQWSLAGNTLYDSIQSFRNHTNDLAGVNVDDKMLVGQEIYGNVVIQGTINIAASNVATVNLSKTSYPLLNVGDRVVINTNFYFVTGKTYTIHSPGTVSVNNASDNTKVTTASVSTLNLANVLLATGSTLKIQPGMYINVNSEIKQVNTINALGDYLTVTRPFRNSVNTGTSLYKETGFTVNTNFVSTNTDLTVAVNDIFVANSICLDNVITGNGTSFTSVLSVGDKIYYDELEYFVEAVTNTTITVDSPLRGKEGMVVYKVIDERYTQRFSETYGPEDVIDDFSLARELFDGMANADGTPFISDLTTKYRASNGQYMTVSAYNPSNVAKSLENGPAYMNAINKTVQGLLDDLQNDAIRFMSENELTLYLEDKLNEIDNLRATLNDAIQEDLAAINAVKGLIKGLLKFWKHACGRKNLKTGEEAIEDDEFLESVLVPNPARQGCQATESDLIDILNRFSDELDTPENEPQPDPAPTPPTDVDLDLFNVVPDALFILEREKAPGANGDILVDGIPDPNLPPVLKDPCVEPC